MLNSLFISNRKIKGALQIGETEDNEDLIYIKSSNNPIKNIVSEKKISPVWILDGTIHNVYINGASGLGKTYVANILANSYHESYPRNKIVLISGHKNDPSFTLPSSTYKIRVDRSIIEDRFELEEFENSLIIMDDIEAFEKDIIEALLTFYEHILKQGRHWKISSILIRHTLFDGFKYKNIIQNSDIKILFINGNKFPVINYLKRFLMMDNNMIKKIVNQQSRWIIINNNPFYIMSQESVIIP